VANLERSADRSGVTIRRWIHDVFSLSNVLRNLSHFLGDVMVVELLDHATYRWTIQGRLSVRLSSLGVVTPSQAFGADFVLSLPGCSRMDIANVHPDGDADLS
jgi:hypothetical protein